MMGNLENRYNLKYHNDEKLYLGCIVFCLSKEDKAIVDQPHPGQFMIITITNKEQVLACYYRKVTKSPLEGEWMIPQDDSVCD